ncbi:4-hydroxythreonine-4-phosphate dehydrogenase PdxA [Paremcibacter congregatus]|uniref:4-hydroxythreonine-4-phosphate dehydrogenase n=1 Tax=Paremcibacter congregatus TaxID=2043170 RepID=A0A2G4YUU2_9PROT|nr:4-hydroxythreonine-4-phosphate dehydrogenase PdxA [Paremcibacter congregatus]PHZ86099.1 4-hydroxythreonine-4-phosphate dehydrogenase PdxA [Paremcibacter congregatus]QDE27065.1 4-hydroxythreonine-4-phosphate dehydrogenase PdxA [Paremcibacter congregatus]
MPSSTINNSLPQDALPLAVSLGEPAGIGPEIIIKAWAERQTHQLPPFFVIGAAAILQQAALDIGITLPLRVISSPDQCTAAFDSALPVLDMGLSLSVTSGKPSAKTAPLVLGAIEQATQFIFDGKAAGLVTAPIQKSVLYDAGFDFPGHTEYLAKLCNDHTGKGETSVMMLMGKDLRVVPLTVHTALKDVPASITADLITDTLICLHHALKQDFGLSAPRIAVAGLNPHAGEDGAMGQEEQTVIAPALDKLRVQGMDISGPLPADTMFHDAARARYDAALCMYHDQALIPVKTLDFDGVNITLGLPIVRTSPDHGTALNIAGQNKASPMSMINALKCAAEIARHRTQKV